MKKGQCWNESGAEETLESLRALQAWLDEMEKILSGTEEPETKISCKD